MKKTVFLLTICVVIVSGTWAAHDDQKLRTQAQGYFQVLPEVPKLSAKQQALVKLGEKLYHETALSINRTQSCASCHSVRDYSGVDHQATSKGALGQRGDRNAPTVFNAVHQTVQFWDGRAADLKEQAGGPILNPIEMALPDEKTALNRINELKAYQPLIKAAYGISQLTEYTQITEPLAQYQATLKTSDRFDDWLAGDSKALTTVEKEGLYQFMTVGCVACHNGALLGGNSFQKLGVVKAYPNQKDLGRYELTKNPKDKMFFKVPMLRNIGRTGPYFHDGSQKTLEDAVKTMATYQLGRELKPEQLAQITAFLRSLDDKNA